MSEQIALQGFSLRFFDGREVRAVWHEGEWWYSTADAVGAFALSDSPSKYWSALKKRVFRGETSTICRSLPIVTKQGRKRPIDCSNEQMLLRIVQSMPTVQVEHIRQWLAEVGAERLREERDPELITKRAIETNKRRYGMTDAEAAQAVQSTAARNQLTRVWKEHGITKGRDYAALTDVGHRATFDVSVKEHKAVKDLDTRENLRPHMTQVERALVMLQETAEEEIIRTRDLHGFYPIRNAAVSSGAIAARARTDIEQQTKQNVVSPQNRKQRRLTD